MLNTVLTQYVMAAVFWSPLNLGHLGIVGHFPIWMGHNLWVTLHGSNGLGQTVWVTFFSIIFLR